MFTIYPLANVKNQGFDLNRARVTAPSDFVSRTVDFCYVFV